LRELKLAGSNQDTGMRKGLEKEKMQRRIERTPNLALRTSISSFPMPCSVQNGPLK